MISGTNETTTERHFCFAAAAAATHTHTRKFGSWNLHGTRTRGLRRASADGAKAVRVGASGRWRMKQTASGGKLASKVFGPLPSEPEEVKPLTDEGGRGGGGAGVAAASPKVSGSNGNVLIFRFLEPEPLLSLSVTFYHLIASLHVSTIHLQPLRVPQLCWGPSQQGG